MSRKQRRTTRHYSEKADPNIQVVVAQSGITPSPIIVGYFGPLIEVWYNLFYFPLTAVEQKHVTLTHVTQRMECQIISMLREERKPLLLPIFIWDFILRLSGVNIMTEMLIDIVQLHFGKVGKMCISFCTHGGIIP